MCRLIFGSIIEDLEGSVASLAKKIEESTILNSSININTETKGGGFLDKIDVSLPPSSVKTAPQGLSKTSAATKLHRPNRSQTGTNKNPKCE